MDLVHSYYDEILLFGAKNGKEELEKHLEETLPDMTKNGSNDDITICGFYYPESIKQFEEKFNTRMELNNIQAELDDVNRRIKSADGSPKMIALEKNLKTSEELLEGLRVEFERLSEDRDNVLSDLKNISVEDEISDSDIFSKIKAFLEREFVSFQMKQCALQCQEILQKYSDVEEKYKKAQEKFDEDKKAYDEYMERYNGFLAKREELLQKLSEIKN